MIGGRCQPPFAPSAPVQRRLQDPPAKSKFLAVTSSSKTAVVHCPHGWHIASHETIWSIALAASHRWKCDEIKKVLFRIDKAGSISGSFQLQTKDNGRGFTGTGHGRIQFDAHGKLKTFELLVTGQHWGEGQYTKGARPGKTPLGFVFQLSDGKKAQDTIPPQGMSWEKGYWEAWK